MNVTHTRKAAVVVKMLALLRPGDPIAADPWSTGCMRRCLPMCELARQNLVRIGKALHHHLSDSDTLRSTASSSRLENGTDLLRLQSRYAPDRSTAQDTRRRASAVWVVWGRRNASYDCRIPRRVVPGETHNLAVSVHVLEVEIAMVHG